MGQHGRPLGTSEEVMKTGADKAIDRYRRAVINEMWSSRGNSCMDAMQWEVEREAAERELKELLR
jgi:hypothetical protein